MGLRKTATTIFGFLIVLSGTVALQIEQLQQLQQNKAELSEAELNLQTEQWRRSLVLQAQLPSFGYANLVANWTFLQFLQYFGDLDVRQVTGYSLSPDFFSIIVEHDPLFVDAYLYLTNSVSMYAGQPKMSVELMQRGLQAMAPAVPPKGYVVWRYKGTDELLFLGDSRAAQQSFATAADWAGAVGTPEAEAIARISRQTAEFLAADPNSRVAQINAWMQVLAQAVDDATRARAIREIEELGGAVVIGENGQVSVRYQTEEGS